MYVFRKVHSLRRYLDDQVRTGRSVGFVPTMGALHDGHLSLVRSSMEQTDCTTVSIFVNPTQFNEAGDLDKYPRPLQSDLQLLYDAGCETVLVPSVQEVYPPELDTSLTFDLDGLDKTMEGEFRPGHFEGMAQVVKRLLDIVQPDKLFMGQKDFQQLTIIRHMVSTLNLDVELLMCPTMREADGLAMSSRNTRLTPGHRERAAIIYQTLSAAMANWGVVTLDQLKKDAMTALAIPGFRPEYFEIVNGYNLQPLTTFSKDVMAVACCAVWAGEVRLIDNIILNDTVSHDTSSANLSS